MSTDLEFLHDLSKIRLLTVKTTRTTAQASKDAAADHDIAGNDVEAPEPQDNECRTPTSEEYRIPKILDCPPAPRKPRRAPSCKRKLSPELHFFEIVNPEEVDAFFRSSFEKISAITSSKRCCCPCKWSSLLAKVENFTRLLIVINLFFYFPLQSLLFLLFLSFIYCLFYIRSYISHYCTRLDFRVLTVVLNFEQFGIWSN